MKGNKPARKFFIDFHYDICIIKQRENKGFNVFRLPDGRFAFLQRGKGV
jgi:hypothetical protein